MQVEVRHLQIVDAIHRLGSMTRAAHALHLTQPAVSHALRELERRIGVELFRRRGRGLEITAAGERFARRAQIVLSELREIEGEMSGFRTGDGGVLRLVTECYTCYHWLPQTLAELQRRLPRLRLELAAEATRRPIEAVLDREADLAVVSRRVEHAELELAPLFSDELVAVVAPDHPLAERPWLLAEDFRDEHLILHFDPETSVVFTELLGPAGISPARCSQLYLTEAVVETVKAGLGVSTLARWAVAPHLRAGTLRAVPLTEKGFFRRWWACHLRSAAERPAVVELVKLLRERGLDGVGGHRVAGT